MAKTDERKRGGSYENLVVGIFTLSGGVAALDTQAAFFVMPFIAPELGLDNFQVGLVGTAALLIWSLSGFISGPLVDRIGRRKPVLIGAFLLFTLFSVGTAFAVSFATFILARMLVSVAQGPVIPIEQAVVHAESSPHRLGLNMGLTQNFGAQLIGSLLAPLVLVWVAEQYGWRNAFLVAAIPGLLIALLIAFFVREPVMPEAQPRGSSEPIATQVRTMLDSHNVRLCLLIGSCTVAWYFVQLGFLPLYLTRDLGISPTTMSQIITAFGIAGLVSAVGVPALSDRIGRKPVLILFSALAAIAPIGVYLAGSNAAQLFAALFLGCLIIGTIPIFMATIPVESVPVRYAATVTGLVMGVTQIAGGIIGPIASGAMADRFGLSVTIWISAALALIATLSALFLKETRTMALSNINANGTSLQRTR